MILDLDGSQGEWFTFFESRINEKGELVYDDPKPDAGRVCVRNLAPFWEKVREKRKKKFEFVLNPQSRSMERVGYFEEQSLADQKKELEDAWDYAITGLENFFNGNGQAIPCTREYKIKLMAVPVFDRFMARCFQLLSSSGVKVKEEAEKN